MMVAFKVRGRIVASHSDALTKSVACPILRPDQPGLRTASTLSSRMTLIPQPRVSANIATVRPDGTDLRYVTRYTSGLANAWIGLPETLLILVRRWRV
jgi:hypothetical protein